MIAMKLTRKRTLVWDYFCKDACFLFLLKKHFLATCRAFPQKYFQPYFYILVGMYQAALADP
jgi:hypothetical protein